MFTTWTNLTTRVSRLFRSSDLSARNFTPRSRQVRLGVETLETRDLPSVSMGAVLPHSLGGLLESSQTAGTSSKFLSGSAPMTPYFTATAVSGSQINLAWNYQYGVSSYLVDEWVNGAWKQLGSVGGGSTGCQITGLSANTTYYFDVGASNYAGTVWANYQSATTSGQYNPPAAPSFTATAVSGSQINLAWNAQSGVTSYLVDEWVNGAWKQLGSVAGSSTGCQITGLSANTTYYFDVGASNAAGTAWANYQSATTSGTPINTTTVNHPTAATAYTAVSGSLFGANGPSFLDVHQGQVGDCWLLSSLAEVAARYPNDIRNMFTAAGTTVENGVTVSLYKVRFFNSSGVAQYVTVDTELPSGGKYYDQPINGVLWVALAEKAYAEANGASVVTTGSVGSDSYNALNEGDPAWALRAITGKSASDYAINPSNIAAAWNAGQLIVMGTRTPTSSYVVGGHAYAVVGYNPSSSNPFEVFNPWGGTTSSVWCPQDPKVYGLFFANASFLSQNFASYDIGTGAAAGITDHGNGSLDVTGLSDTNAADSAPGTHSARHHRPDVDAAFLPHNSAAGSWSAGAADGIKGHSSQEGADLLFTLN